MRPAFKNYLIRYYKPLVIDFGKKFLLVCLLSFTGRDSGNQFFRGFMVLGIFSIWLGEILFNISKNREYRNDEFYLIPLNETELRFMHILKSSYSILISALCLFGVALIYGEENDLSSILTFLILGFPIFVLVVIEGKFKINFIRRTKKMEILVWIADFVDGGKWVVRSGSGIILFCFLLFFNIKFNFIFLIIILFLPFVISYGLIVYNIWFGDKILNLNEFVQFENSCPKPFPFIFNGLSIIAFFLLIGLFVNEVSSRTPASVPTIHANPSTQLRK